MIDALVDHYAILRQTLEENYEPTNFVDQLTQTTEIENINQSSQTLIKKLRDFEIQTDLKEMT